MELPIVFQNENFIVVDKPAGWLSVPARFTDDPRPVLGRELERQLSMRLYPVHRLDFEVSGLILWAATPEAQRLAQPWFEEHLIVKTYSALARVNPTEQNLAADWVDWRSQIVRGKRRSFEATHGKPAHTQARFIAETVFTRGLSGEELLNVGQWELKPLTGRSHQLRFEMAKHGTPIVGDTLYGGSAVEIKDWIALRAVQLDLSQIALSSRMGLPNQIVGTPLNLRAF